MVTTVKVADTSPKAIVRELLREGKGPRDMDGMNAILDDWHKRPEAGDTFSRYCKKQAWTLGQVLSFLSFQCLYIWYSEEDEFMDAVEFEEMWRIFRPVIKEQGLLDVEKAVKELTISTPAPTTRAAALEV